MSIVKMQKVAVLGIDTCKEKLMNQLIDLEAVQLIDQAEKLSDSFVSENLKQDDGLAMATEYEQKISRAAQSLEVINKYGEIKSPLFNTRRIVDETDFYKSVSDSSGAESLIDTLLSLNERIKDVQERINKIDSDSVFLSPWSAFDVPLNETETTRTKTVLGIAPADSDIESIERTLDETTDSSVFRIVNKDDSLYYLAFTTMKEDIDVFLSKIKETGFSVLSFDSFTGTPAEITEQNRIEREKQLLLLKDYESQIKNLAGKKSVIEDYSDNLTIKLEKEKIKSKILKTEKTFLLEGWMPVRLTDKVESIFKENGCIYQFSEPEEGDEVPVLLSNSKFFSPIEAVTEMYSLPAYGSFDPTSIYALWYICFFGMMFSDVCYGLIMTVFCWWALRKFNLEGTTYKMIKGFLYCGISTMFWGAMFGGYFGDFFEVFASTILGKNFEIRPLWFDPLQDPLKLLIFSLILGIIHIFIGMGISIYMKIRDKDIVGAIFGEFAWYTALIGSISWVAFGYFKLSYVSISKWVTIVGAVMVFIGGGLEKKGLFKITGGIINLYNITSYMSDILSYSRILALGLATSVIAQVVNMMGALGGGGVKGAIILLLVFIVGQLVNFAINVLGSFVHASRLQYIEFFGKFYVDGGEGFDPFRKKTKYVKIENNK